MRSTQASRREIFRTIAATSYRKWPAYHSTSLYDRSSLGGLEEDIRTVARVWFDHDSHESVESFMCYLPLAYLRFEPHNRYSGTTRYGMEQLVRALLLKELHGWEHKSALVEYLHQHPRLCEYLNFESVPDQSTLWRTWHQWFTPDLKETIEKGEILIAPSSDPGWTPLFLNAAGMVVEVGGQMSHGALVAREYGLPAVVSVPEATRRIETGQQVRLDGTNGTVEIIEDD